MAKRPTSALVIDASVAVKWHLVEAEEDVDRAVAILQGFLKGDTELWAPEYICYEVPAAIARATRRTPPRLQPEAGREAIEEFLSLPLRTVNSADLLRAAYPLVHRYEIALYDALYVALAERLNIPFVLADQQLFERVGRLSGVQWLGDYRPA